MNESLLCFAFSLLVALATASGCADTGSTQTAVIATAAQPEAAETLHNENNAEASNETESVIIPLDKIRRGGPGSRQLRDLEPEFFVYRDTPEKIAKYSTPEGLKEMERIIERAKKHSLVYAIEQTMSSMPTEKNAEAGTGFAVRGTDRVALQGVYDVLVQGNQPEESFPSGTELSIVFYTLPIQPFVRLDRVERAGNLVEIRHMLVSHGRMIINWHLSLIPLGKLPPGTYTVEINRATEKEKKFNEKGFPRVMAGLEQRVICKPFSFRVAEDRSSKEEVK